MKSVISKLALLLCIVPLPAFAGYKADVIRVIDGDTVKLAVHVWPGLIQEINLRLDGVNTPEKRSSAKCERAAGRAATDFTVRFMGGESVEVTDVSLGKYAGRVLGKISVDGVDLGTALIEAGHAKPYSGGHREAWCTD